METREQETNSLNPFVNIPTFLWQKHIRLPLTHDFVLVILHRLSYRYKPSHTTSKPDIEILWHQITPSLVLPPTMVGRTTLSQTVRPPADRARRIAMNRRSRGTAAHLTPKRVKRESPNDLMRVADQVVQKIEIEKEKRGRRYYAPSPRETRSGRSNKSLFPCVLSPF